MVKVPVAKTIFSVPKHKNSLLVYFKPKLQNFQFLGKKIQGFTKKCKKNQPPKYNPMGQISAIKE